MIFNYTFVFFNSSRYKEREGRKSKGRVEYTFFSSFSFFSTTASLVKLLTREFVEYEDSGGYIRGCNCMVGMVKARTFVNFVFEWISLTMGT